MLVATSREALFFLPLVTPIALWIAFTDMKYMKIRNQAVLALVAVFAVAGLFALPLADYGWRWLHLAIVLVIGFGLTTVGLVGGGDSKYAAAMAPFVAWGDVRLFLALFMACIIAAFVAHRLLRALPAVRRATPDWLSWTHRKFPMGLALSGTLVIYLGLALAYGAGA